MQKTVKNKAYPLLVSLMLVALLIATAGCSKDKTTTPDTNHPPVVASVIVSPGSVAFGGTATVTVSATDQDGDALTYTFTVTGGSIVPAGASATWTLPSSAGNFVVNVSVSDGKATTLGTGGCTVQTPSTRIVGTLTLPAGHPGNLYNTKVSIYATVDDWFINRPAKYVAVTGSGSSVSYTIDNVPPGTYYLDAWKDLDNTQTWSVGDLVGWYGSGGLGSVTLTPLPISQYETKTINLDMIDIF